jgi:hypothetical protein
MARPVLERPLVILELGSILAQGVEAGLASCLIKPAQKEALRTA